MAELCRMHQEPTALVHLLLVLEVLVAVAVVVLVVLRRPMVMG
jgi:hypothetical protein